MGTPADPEDPPDAAPAGPRDAPVTDSAPPVPAVVSGEGGAARSRYRDALRHRDLRLLIAAFLVDQIGSWSYFVVIAVYVFDRTHSTQWLAALGICRWGPSLLLASYGGVIADRYERITVLITSALASAALMTGMAAVVAVGAPAGFVLAITVLAGTVLAPYRSAAAGLTPDVVGEKDLAAANSLFSALENLVVVIGPAIGGLLLLTGRPAISVAINAASFVMAAAILSRLRTRSRGAGGTEGSFARQWVSGLRALAVQPIAVAIILFCALDSAIYGASTVLYAPLSIRLGTGPNGYSYLLAGAALGGVLGAGLANRISRVSRLAPVIMGGICLQALPFAATAPVRSPALAAVLQVASGAGMVIIDVLAITSMQRDLPKDVLSRVFGVFESLVMSGILLANLATGILLAHAHVVVALLAVGLGFPVIALAGLPTLLRADRTSATVAKRLRPRVELLSALDLLADAPRTSLERLAAAAEEVVVPDGTVLIREGDPADALWVLGRGKLSVHALGDGRTPRDLGVVTAPGYVGELGLLHGITRTATVQAAEQSTLLRIGGQEFLAALQAGRPSASLVSVAGARMARTPARIPQPQPPPGRA
jgi:predicted MFS family arabinose efflux permease